MESEFKMKIRGFSLMFLVLVLLVHPTTILGRENRDSHPLSSCKSSFLRLGASVVKSATVVGGIALGLTLGSELVGNVLDTPPIGLSIYLDYENILSALEPEERAEFQKEKPDLKTLSEILVYRLSTKNTDGTEIFPYLNPRMASSYFTNEPVPADVCRHKALIMQAVLKKAGFDSNLMTGTIATENGRGEHVWLYIPQLKKMADPMNGVLANPEEYERIFESQSGFNIVQWAKPMGILGR